MINANLDAEQAYAQARAYGKDLARLYTAEKERRKELEKATQKLQTIYDTVPTGLAVVDDALTLLEANPRFLALFEQTSDCLGQSLAKLLPTGELVKTMRLMEAQVAPLGSVEVTVSTPVERTLLITLAPLSGKQDWVLVLHDLTERNRLEGLKSEFVNIAAHELRTPLAGIIGFTSLLQENFADVAMVEELVRLILQSTQRLKAIVDELVNFAATYRTGDNDLRIVEVDLNSLLQKSIKVLQSKIEAKELAWILELPDEPLLVRGDPMILGEIIFHLLDNAVVFNKPEGRIIIRAQQFPVLTSSTEQVSRTTVVEIEDTGIGIPQVDLDKIFDKFYQVQEHLTRSTGGLGLGLTIARHGVERHGGSLTVRSQLGKGSIFRIVLPSIVSLSDISIDSRVDMAHQQTLAYARDMARAVVTERQMSKRMERINSLSADLEEKLNGLAQSWSESSLAESTSLDQLQDTIRMLKELSAP